MELKVDIPTLLIAVALVQVRSLIAPVPNGRRGLELGVL